MQDTILLEVSDEEVFVTDDGLIYQRSYFLENYDVKCDVTWENKKDEMLESYIKQTNAEYFPGNEYFRFV